MTDKLTISQYVSDCSRTAKKLDNDDGYNENYKQMLDHYSMGIAEESSELLSLIYDHYYNNKWINTEEFIDEAGDYLWYNAMFAEHVKYIGSGPVGSADGFGALIHDVTGFPHKHFAEIDKQEHSTFDSETRDKLILKYGMDCSVNAGKVLSKIKKVVHFNHPLDIDKFSKYHVESFHAMLRLCSFLNIKLEDIATKNIDKLKKRYPEGFTDQASLNRTN